MVGITLPTAAASYGWHHTAYRRLNAKGESEGRRLFGKVTMSIHERVSHTGTAARLQTGKSRGQGTCMAMGELACRCMQNTHAHAEHTCTHTHTHTLSLSMTHTQTHTYIYTHTLSVSLSHTHTHTHTHTHGNHYHSTRTSFTLNNIKWIFHATLVTFRPTCTHMHL